DSPVILPLSPDESDSVADSRQRIGNVEHRERAVKKMIEAAREYLLTARRISLTNSSAATGSADFTLKFDLSGNPVAIHQISGDQSLNNVPALQTTNFPIQIPSGSKIEIPVRGTLACSGEKHQCNFLLLTADDALDLARRESAVDAPVAAQSPTQDPHTYSNAAIGMKVSLPSEWRLISEEPGTYSRPHNAILGKPGAMAFFLLTRERMEGPPDLYRKMLEAGLSQHEEYRRTGETEVKQDGMPGTRWNVGWKDKGVTYVGIMEFFSVGDDHYRLTAMSPSEVYSRYADDFESMMQSVRFPMLHYDPKGLGNSAPQ
ncbi:MAG TPA: hypothetical protein VMD76_14500, partial [Candidatus Sulfotelmatobacter sp.]|nr:hypothetical protein [Candidatus Sulfotelmatobacter sp.]